MLHVVFTPLYPPERAGGIEIILQRTCTALGHLGDRAIVFALSPSSEQVNASCQAQPARDGECERVAVFRVRYSASDMNGTQAVFEAQAILEDAAGRSGIDWRDSIVHSTDWFTARAAKETARRHRRPLITTFHFVKAVESAGRMTDTAKFVADEQWLAARESAVNLVYSPSLQRDVETHLGVCPERICRFAIGICPHGSNFRKPRDPYEFLYAGRLAAEKDIPTLVDAYGMVAAEVPQARLTILGSGPQEAQLKQRARNLEHGSANVRFIPFSQRPEVVQFHMDRAGTLVLPSTYDAFGMVVAEALERFLPVIVSDGVGAAYLLESVPSAVFPRGRVEALADCMRWHINHYAQCRSDTTNLVRSVSRSHTWDSAARQIRAACYGSVGRNHPVGGAI